MNVDYATLASDLEDESFRKTLEAELTVGFRQIRDTGERLPTASHYASQIAEIVHRGAPAPIDSELAFYLYQEILAACEAARETVLAEV